MQLRQLALITTFVLLPLGIFAAPAPTEPNLDPGSQSEKSPSTPSPALEDMRITEPPEKVHQRSNQEPDQDYFYPFQSAMGPRLGLFLEPHKLAEDESIRYLIGFFYLLPSHSQGKFELGADLQSDRTGRVNGYYRYIFKPSASFRPYWKAGFTCLVESEQGLANFINYRQYGARLGLGLEETFRDPASFRWDLESIISLKEVSFLLVFGYSWGW